MYRHLLSLFALVVMLSAALSSTAGAVEEESGVAPLPSLSVGSANVGAGDRISDKTTNNAVPSAEAVDCFYEWNKNEPACAEGSANKKDARP